MKVYARISGHPKTNGFPTTGNFEKRSDTNWDRFAERLSKDEEGARVELYEELPDGTLGERLASAGRHLR